MEEEKRLYPLKFFPIAETAQWGGHRISERFRKSFVKNDDQGNERPLGPDEMVSESHETADLGYRDSLVREGWLAGNTLSELMDMYVDRICGEDVFEYYGRQFPVGVKFIDAREKTPLMVCPDDELAADRYDFLGKTKLWYVVEAGPAATLMLGMKQDVTAEEFYNACQDSTVDTLLNSVCVKPGDSFLIRPGMVHCAEDVLLAEIDEASPMDFILCSWGRPDEDMDESMSLVEALDFIDYKASTPAILPQYGQLVKCPQFTVGRISLKAPLHISCEQPGSFTMYLCLSGEALVRPEGDLDGGCHAGAGETVLIPAEINDYYLSPAVPGTVLLEIMVERTSEPDGYIDPDAEESIDEE